MGMYGIRAFRLVRGGTRIVHDESRHTYDVITNSSLPKLMAKQLIEITTNMSDHHATAEPERAMVPA